MPEVRVRAPFASAVLLLTVGAVGVLARVQWCVELKLQQSPDLGTSQWPWEKKRQRQPRTRRARALGGGAAWSRSWILQDLRTGSSCPTWKPRGGLPPLSGVPRGSLPVTAGLALAPREPASRRPTGPAGSRQRVGLSRLSVPCFPLPAWGLEICTP
ncbi:hypothetical protein J1605_011240 [Eschrichtius robustus]|uniref:Uncharacterized protein n=1 Tax=Eschrichtius robustus TaxID=9764 RepID=A0AB34GLQ7_ESCRO|nr:hypothetical protein J1605_011240 [Eschrichtius robustus]